MTYGLKHSEKSLVQNDWTGLQRMSQSESSEASSAVLSEVPLWDCNNHDVTYETYSRRQSDTVQRNNKLTAEKHCHLRFNNYNKMTTS